MGRFNELYAKYGEWMKSEDVVETTGIGSCCAPGHYAIRGAEQRRTVIGGRRRVLYRTADVARNLDRHDAEGRAAEAAMVESQPLCGTCRWRSRDGTGNAGYCDYCLQPGHHTKHWHREHGVPDALDAAHCPFYEPGGDRRCRTEDWLMQEKKGWVTESEKH